MRLAWSGSAPCVALNVIKNMEKDKSFAYDLN